MNISPKLMLELYHRLFRVCDVEGENLTVRELRILIAVARASYDGKPVSSRDIRDELELSAAAVSRGLVKLLERDWVRGHRCQEDARRWWLWAGPRFYSLAADHGSSLRLWLTHEVQRQLAEDAHLDSDGQRWQPDDPAGQPAREN